MAVTKFNIKQRFTDNKKKNKRKPFVMKEKKMN